MIRLTIALSILAILFIGENSNAQTASIKYPASSFVFYPNQQVSIVPTLSGFQGPVVPNCNANPLPPGLSINATTCVISGMVAPNLPVGGITQAVVIVSFGVPAPITLNISEMPASIVYPMITYQFYAGQQVNIVPQVNGFLSPMVPNCTANPLPPGLSINATTCVISGMIASGIPASGFHDSVVIMSPGIAAADNLTINVSPQTIIYPQSSYKLYANQQVNIVPQLIGFQPNMQPNCNANPLPPGLTINMSTCVISGTLSSYVPPAGFNDAVVINSPSLEAPVTLNISVSPPSIVYPLSSYQLYAGQQVNLVPQLSGFQPNMPANCNANPLPPGLVINLTTCAISGLITMGIPLTGLVDTVSVNSPGLDAPVVLTIKVNILAVLKVVGSNYDIVGISGMGPELKYQNAAVTVGEFSGWTPVGAAQTASGYDVAWKNSGTPAQYTVWSTDAGGNYVSSALGTVSGTSYALEEMELTFNQDLNGDGLIGPTTVVIRVDGSTSLTEVANEFFLYHIGTGPSLKYQGAAVVSGQFGGWVPIGAVQTSSGYDVAWKLPGSPVQYTVWSTDSIGNYLGSLTGTVSGTSTVLENLENAFDQDLNGDGVIGVP